MDYSAIANLPNLQPGSTGPSVVQLQQWLVKNGFMTQQQMNTGPGTYGPQTKAAVAAWQQQAGFNTQGNPGYFGPLSKTYIQQQSAAKAPAQTQQQPQQQTQSSMQLATLGAIGSVAKNAYTNTGQQLGYQQALQQAAQDPNILAKYGDALKIDQQAFQQNLQYLQQQTSTAGQQMQMKFENDRKALAEQFAGAGEAYSGFRGKAQQQLGQQESALVQSSRADLQKKLQDATSAFEAQYGSAATTPASASFMNPLQSSQVGLSGLMTPGVSGTENVSGALTGGITGAGPLGQKQDVLGQAQNLINLSKSPI